MSEVKTGTFTQSVAGVGTQQITGVGFTPRVLILWSAGTPTALNTTTGGWVVSFGISTGAGESFVAGAASEGGDSDVAGTVDDGVGRLYDWDATLLAQAEFASFDADGFTLNWTTNDNVARPWGYVVIGGEIDAKVVRWVTNAGVGNQSVVGAGFAPEMALHVNLPLAGALPTNSGLARLGVGLQGPGEANGAAPCIYDEAYLGGLSRNSCAFPYTTASGYHHSICGLNRTGGGMTFDMYALPISLDADGCTVNITLAGAGSYNVGTLFMRGVNMQMGVLDRPGGIATQDETGFGWDPTLVLFFHARCQPTDTVTGAAHIEGYWYAGAYDGTDQQAIGLVTQWNSITPNTRCYHADDCATFFDVDTTVSKGVCSFIPDGFRMTWNPNDGYSAYDYAYLAFGEVVGPEPPPPPPPPPPEPIVSGACVIDPGLMGRYQVIIRDSDGTPLAVLDDESGFTELEYVKAKNGHGYHGWGHYRLRLPFKHPSISSFGLDHIVEVRRRVPGRTVWTTDFEGLHRRSVFNTDDTDQTWFTSYGPDLKSLLKRRIILLDAVGDFFSRDDHFANIMREVVRYNCGPDCLDPARNLINFTVEPNGDEGPTLERNVRYTKVFEELELLSEAEDADFDVVRNGEVLTFKVYVPIIGVDRRVGNGFVAPTIFSPERGNMLTPEVDKDRIEEITVTYVGGDGIGAAREVVERMSLYDAQGDSLWNRIEDFLQGSQDINTATLQAMGDAHLMENKEKLSFNFRAVPTAGCLYGRDWNVGDLVTGRYLGTDYDIQVAEVMVNVKDQGEVLEPVFLYLPERLY